MIASGGLSDDDIVSRIREGDENMLLLLYKKNLDKVKSYILRNSGNNEDVEDVFQECLIIAWQNIQNPSFTLQSQLDTYIFAICKNLWFKELRKKGRYVNDNFESTTPTETAEVFYSGEQDDMAAALSKYMDQIGDVCKELLSLFYFEKWDMEKIAAKLNLANADTAKAKKYQCKKKLEELMRKHFKKEDLL
jgi:RNA polymerase sigma factor (sigma-70 family)